MALTLPSKMYLTMNCAHAMEPLEHANKKGVMPWLFARRKSIVVLELELELEVELELLLANPPAFTDVHPVSS